jgi:predicted O-methyltransferase YrrM
MNKGVFKPFLLIGSPLTFISSLWLKFVMKAKSHNHTLEDTIFNNVGLLPVVDHYYQPLITPKKHLKKSLRDDRTLPGINFNIDEQLSLLSKFNYNTELLQFPIDRVKNESTREYYYNNGSYLSGDSEYLYNMVRHFKPKKIIEVGSGFSTLMAKNAIIKNTVEDSSYQCRQICIEPYEQPWLENLGLEVIREKIEVLNRDVFKQLESTDILFIDSSHIIRPQGDVLCEFLEILPLLNPGVLIHVHDIFTPKDYLDNWIYDLHLLWNEQYLLEAFLCFNDKFRIIGATNFLSHHYSKEFSAKCPVFAKQENREPGAFWMVKS